MHCSFSCLVRVSSTNFPDIYTIFGLQWFVEIANFYSKSYKNNNWLSREGDEKNNCFKNLNSSELCNWCRKVSISLKFDDSLILFFCSLFGSYVASVIEKKSILARIFTFNAFLERCCRKTLSRNPCNIFWETFSLQDLSWKLFLARFLQNPCKIRVRKTFFFLYQRSD